MSSEATSKPSNSEESNEKTPIPSDKAGNQAPPVKDSEESIEGDTTKNSNITVIAASVGAVVGVLLVALIFYICIRRRKRRASGNGVTGIHQENGTYTGDSRYPKAELPVPTVNYTPVVRPELKGSASYPSELETDSSQGGGHAAI